MQGKWDRAATTGVIVAPAPYWLLDECEACGAAIGFCADWPWHRADEDCRALRQPWQERE